MAVPEYYYAVVPLVAIAAFVWWRALLRCVNICGSRNDRSRDAFIALHSPSVRTARSAFDRRIALAVREANRGFFECSACGFTNPTRVRSCVACGAAVARKPSSLSRVLGCGRDANLMVELEESARQWRVRRRKEWTREVATDGNVVWRHDSRLTASSTNATAFFVVQLRPAETVSHLHPLPLSTSIADHVAIDINNESPFAATPAIACVTQSLQNLLDDTPISMHEVFDGAPVQTAQGENVAADTSTFASTNFPSKLAHFITSMASLFNESTTGTDDVTEQQLCTTRETLVADSLLTLATIPAILVRQPIRVEFAGEQGIDAGGVYREWFFLLNEAIIQPTTGIFTCVDQQDQTFYLNPHSQAILGEHHLAHVFATGRLLGRALLEGNVTGFHLALPLLKIVLGLPVGFGDLQYFDPDMHKNLQWLLENDGAEHLGLDFTVTEKLSDGTVREVELIPGGSEVEVTDENKVEFVERKLKYHLIESVQDQLLAFLKGVYEVVPAELLVLFDAEELDYVLSGSTRVPPGGFSALTSNDGRLCLFSLRGVVAKETRGYLHSHACFNRVDLPMHRSVKEMREAVHAAIAVESIGFTTA